MKIGEILRQLADAIDAESAQESDGSDLGIVNAAGLVPNVSIGPLQQELELLKKTTGVENDVDHFASDDADAEIIKMQHNAGISQQPIIINQTFQMAAPAPLALPAPEPVAVPESLPEPTPAIESTKQSQFGRSEKPTSRSSIKSQFGTSRASE